MISWSARKVLHIILKKWRILSASLLPHSAQLHLDSGCRAETNGFLLQATMAGVFIIIKEMIAVHRFH